MEWPKELVTEAKNILENCHGKNVSPSKEDALRFFQLKPNNIKVIILGQDPYPTPGVANGRAFAVNKNAKIPQSLKNIFKEIILVNGTYNTDRTLKHWENQGVLLLNTSLTVKNFQPNSHKEYWKNFTNKLITWLDKNFKVTWVLWGNEAKKYKKILNNNVVSDAHPSPLSIRYRNKNTFKEIKSIDW